MYAHHSSSEHGDAAMDTSATAGTTAGTSAIAQLDQEFLDMGHPMEIDLSGAFDDDTYMANLFGGSSGVNGSGSNGAAGLMPQQPYVKE
jgi:hypothetical protein